MVPVAGSPEDEAALARIAAVFGDREVVRVPGNALNEGGGGPHCITQQIPSGTLVSPCHARTMHRVSNSPPATSSASPTPACGSGTDGTMSATATSGTGVREELPLPPGPVRPGRAGQRARLLIAGVVVIDPFLGVIKTNIGIKDGRIAGIGRAGNPDITAGVELTIGPDTWPVNGYGLSPPLAGMTATCTS